MEWLMNWWWATVVGPVILGCAIGYALVKRRRLSPGEKAAQREGTERQYRSPGVD